MTSTPKKVAWDRLSAQEKDEFAWMTVEGIREKLKTYNQPFCVFYMNVIDYIFFADIAYSPLPLSMVDTSHKKYRILPDSIPYNLIVEWCEKASNRPFVLDRNLCYMRVENI